MVKQKEEDLQAGMSALSDFGELSQEDAEVLEAAPAAATSLQYEHYVSLPRVSLNPMLSVLESLTKLVASISGKDVHIAPKEDFIEFRYANSGYNLLYRVVNITGLSFPAFAMKVEHLKKLVGTVDSHLVLVWDESKSSGADMFMHVAGNLIDVEKVQFNEQLYEFGMPELPDALDAHRLGSLLPDFASLLSQSERPSERQLLNIGEHSYINIGSVLGKTDSFFNGRTCILSRSLVNHVVTLVGYAGDEVRASFSEDYMEMTFGGLCYFKFIYVSGEMTNRFMSPMFKSSFNYDSAVKFDSVSLSRVLEVIGTLDYFSDTVRLEFGQDACRLLVTRSDTKQTEFTYKYTEGSVAGGVLVVPIPILLSVLAKVTETTKFACQDNLMVVDTGGTVYCVRSVQMA